MPISIAGSGTITGISVGGIPDGVVDTDVLAANAVTTAKLGSAEQSGLCKAFVNFDGSGTVAIRASYNVSSITDNGTGDYTVNFTTAMVDANYSFACSSTNGAGGNSIPSSFSLATILTTSFRMIDARPTGAIDRDTFTANFFR
jgi:hypothetical protein